MMETGGMKSTRTLLDFPGWQKFSRTTIISFSAVEVRAHSVPRANAGSQDTRPNAHRKVPLVFAHNDGFHTEILQRWNDRLG
jgi:hypothetical protein